MNGSQRVSNCRRRCPGSDLTLIATLLDVGRRLRGNREAMHDKRALAALIVVTVLTASRARGEEDARTVQPALTIGALELINLEGDPRHLGTYVTLSLDLTIALNETWALIPSLGFELAPEFGNWGGFFYFIVDRYLTTWGDVIITLDPQLGIIHDALADGSGGFSHAYFASAGIGVSFITSRGLIIPQVTVNYGLDGEGWSISPTLPFSVPF